MKKACIRINKTSQRGQFVITSKDDFFDNEYLIIKVYPDCISIKTPDIDYRGDKYHTSKVNSKYETRRIYITNNRLMAGMFYIDEEDSTEDELIINI